MVGADNTAGTTSMFQALLDSGSQTSSITADAASKLDFTCLEICGNRGQQQTAKESVTFPVGVQKFPVTARVPNSIAGNTPSQHITLTQLKTMKCVAVAKKLPLAWFVQLFLGADVYEDHFLDKREIDQRLHYRESIFAVLSLVQAH